MSPDNGPGRKIGTYTARKLKRLAIRNGISVERTGGRHSIHLVADDGASCPISDHGSRTAVPKFIVHNVIRFLDEHGSKN